MEKSNRPQRNRRHSRRAWPPEDDLHYPRPAKRLFTPEIKRMLKEWLVRRRENPYPSREEKKRLAIDTGLTYTQICNWFANWRRKLKNAEREKSKKSWGHLIKNYNTNAKGNVEQFSISSEDSIWEEEEHQYHHFSSKRDYEDEDLDYLCDIDGSSGGSADARRIETNSGRTDLNTFNKPNYCIGLLPGHKNHSDLFVGREVDVHTTNATCQITGGALGSRYSSNGETKTKYKQKIMEKYLRDTFDPNETSHGINYVLASYGTSTKPQEHQGLDRTTFYCNTTNTAIIKSGAELSKWLESAAKFTPDKNNYFVEWNNKRLKHDKKTFSDKAFTASPLESQRQQQEHHIQQQPAPALTVVPLLYCTTSEVQTQNIENTPTIQQQIHKQQQQQQQHHSDLANHIYNSIHHKDELDAAEALANLAFNCRQRMLDSNVNARSTFQRPLNAISS